MKQRLVMFLAVLFLSIVIALVQTQATGTVTAAEDGSPVIGASIKPKSVIRISLCRTTQRNPNDRFGFIDILAMIISS